MHSFLWFNFIFCLCLLMLWSVSLLSSFCSLSSTTFLIYLYFFSHSLKQFLYFSVMLLQLGAFTTGQVPGDCWWLRSEQWIQCSGETLNPCLLVGEMPPLLAVGQGSQNPPECFRAAAAENWGLWGCYRRVTSGMRGLQASSMRAELSLEAAGEAAEVCTGKDLEGFASRCSPCRCCTQRRAGDTNLCCSLPPRALAVWAPPSPKYITSPSFFPTETWLSPASHLPSYSPLSAWFSPFLSLPPSTHVSLTELLHVCLSTLNSGI